MNKMTGKGVIIKFKTPDGRVKEIKAQKVEIKQEVEIKNSGNAGSSLK